MNFGYFNINISFAKNIIIFFILFFPVKGSHNCVWHRINKNGDEMTFYHFSDKLLWLPFTGKNRIKNIIIFLAKLILILKHPKFKIFFSYISSLFLSLLGFLYFSLSFLRTRKSDNYNYCKIKRAKTNIWRKWKTDREISNIEKYILKAPKV